MPADREITAIEEIAADWMVRRDRGLSPAQEGQLAEWLRADARHRAVFGVLEETWTLMAEVPAGSAGDVARQGSRGRRSVFAWFPIGLAAAAALAIAYVGGWRPGRVAESAASVPFAITASTEVGALRKVDLPDGSVIQLNTDSAVEVNFAPAERRVRLTRGEAHFTVAKNRARPFIVSAAGVDVRVVGTVFNVRLRTESVDVLVTEGKVRVGGHVEGESDVALRPAPVTASELTAGQKVSIAIATEAVPLPAAPTVVSAAEIKQVLAWQTRRLDFDATPLVEIVAEFNRYNRHQLVIGDERLKQQRFGGSFPAGDYATFVRMLEANFGLLAERDGDTTRLRLKR